MKVVSGNVLWWQCKCNWCCMLFIFIVYMFIDRELSVKIGILNERFNLIKLFCIVDISVECMFLQCIFGMSMFVLDMCDQLFGNGVVVLKNVINGFEVCQVLQEVVDVFWKENGMFVCEFFGGSGGWEFGSGLDGLDVDGFDVGVYVDGQ